MRDPKSNEIAFEKRVRHYSTLSHYYLLKIQTTLNHRRLKPTKAERICVRGT
jgi:hypothetical protein